MDIKEVKIAHLKAIMKNEGLSGNKFAKKLKTKTGEPLKPSNLSNYLTGKKEVFDTLASQIMDAFPDSLLRGRGFHRIPVPGHPSPRSMKGRWSRSS